MVRDDPTQPAPVITLDGRSGCGKSTLARRLAEALGWAYLDSGAWYRGLTWAVREAGGDVGSSASILDTLSSIEMHCHSDGVVVVNGRPLRDEIRTPEIDRAVGDVADPPAVRRALNERMQRLRRQAGVRGVVADGRDAGTVIFPDAALKIFVETDAESRARRRHQQLQAAGQEHTLEDVRLALQERDARDAARGESAPHPVDGAHVLDNSNLSVEEAVGRLLAWARTVVDGQLALDRPSAVEPGGRDLPPADPPEVT